ncbi:MAG: hypothetical protein ACI9UN_001564 [Granulosicoccus sp.]|jgi:uncharacterized protein YceK
MLALTLTISVGGCATTSTLSQPAHERKPVVMSGSRLNIAGLLNEPDLRAKYGVAPPDYPLLDLPFSVFLDIIALGYSVPVALIYGR